MSLSKERWLYLKNLQPSPGRYIHVNPHPNRHARLKDNLFDKWDLLTGQRTAQPINKSAQNPLKNARRQFFKYHGHRQALKLIKQAVRESTL